MPANYITNQDGTEGTPPPFNLYGGAQTPAPAPAPVTNGNISKEGITRFAPYVPVPATTLNYAQTYGGQPAPYANIHAQIRDALDTSGRYSSAFPWNNGSGRYAFGGGAQTSSPTAGRQAPWDIQNNGLLGSPGHAAPRWNQATPGGGGAFPGTSVGPASTPPAQPTDKPSPKNQPQSSNAQLQAQFNALPNDAARVAFLSNVQNANAFDANTVNHFRAGGGVGNFTWNNGQAFERGANGLIPISGDGAQTPKMNFSYGD